MVRWSLVVVVLFSLCSFSSERLKTFILSSLIKTLPSKLVIFHLYLFSSYFIFIFPSLQLQTGLGFVPPEPEGGGLERGVGQQRRQNPGHPQGEEPNQLADALPGQVERRTLWPWIWRDGLSLTCYSPVTRSALMSPKRAPTARPGRDRFTAESYTVLGKNTPATAARLCPPMKYKYIKKTVDILPTLLTSVNIEESAAVITTGYCLSSWMMSVASQQKEKYHDS